MAGAMAIGAAACAERGVSKISESMVTGFFPKQGSVVEQAVAPASLASNEEGSFAS